MKAPGFRPRKNINFLAYLRRESMLDLQLSRLSRARYEIFYGPHRTAKQPMHA